MDKLEREVLLRAVAGGCLGIVVGCLIVVALHYWEVL